MRNRLTIIGWEGHRLAFLNVNRDEAIRRYLDANPDDEDNVSDPGFVEEIEFADSFGTYDVWEV